jgi:ABC-2 type transport system ATP-binding protein
VTVFLNSHLLSEVEAVCDRVAIIKEGRVAAMGPKAQLLGGEHVVEVRASGLSAALLGEIERRYALLRTDGGATAAERHIPSATPERHGAGVAIRDGIAAACRITVSLPDTEVPALVDLLAGSGARLYELTPRQRSLEDLFVDIVQVGGDR